MTVNPGTRPIGDPTENLDDLAGMLAQELAAAHRAALSGFRIRAARTRVGPATGAFAGCALRVRAANRAALRSSAARAATLGASALERKVRLRVQAARADEQQRP